MKKNVILVVAPHPDDETLGCGGTLLKHKAAGDSIHWLIASGMKESAGFKVDQIQKRSQEIETVAKMYGFDSVTQLNQPAGSLDTVPLGDLVSSIGEVIKKINATCIYLPFSHDAHTDHSVVFKAAWSCSKWFRYPSVKRVLVYETISETDFGSSLNAFAPNTFINIEPHLNKKIEILNIYASEMGKHPFPRSEHSVRALATLRGATSGFQAAEAFMLLKNLES